MLRGIACIGLLAGVLSSATCAAAGAPVDVPAALGEAQRSGRLVLLHFGANWCAPCRRLERDVFARPELVAALEERFVLVKIDIDQHRALGERYGIQSLPSDVVLAADGSVLSKNNSPQGVAYRDAMLQIAARVPRSGSATAPRATSAGPSGSGEVRVARPPAADPHRAPPTRTSAALPPLGLDGFCPVTLYQSRRWTAGDQRFGAIHRGKLYLFAGAAEQRQFLADPDRFSPVAGGYDPVLAAGSGQWVEGNRRHGVYYGQRVYLFSSDATLQQFWQNPERFAAAPDGTLRR